jgi:hypothetical protein
VKRSKSKTALSPFRYFKYRLGKRIPFGRLEGHIAERMIVEAFDGIDHEYVIWGPRGEVRASEMDLDLELEIS